MSEDCELLANCGYFRKYQNTKEVLCQGFIRQYCKGPLQVECKRMEYRKQHGTPPPDEMMPSGHMTVAEAKNEMNLNKN